MGKFSIRRIITMVILIAAALIGIILGALALTHADALKTTTVMAFFKDNKDSIKAMPNGTIKASYYLAYYGAFGALAIGATAGVMFVIGIILTFAKGKSFGMIMMIVGILLVIMALAIGFVAFESAKHVMDPIWLAKNALKKP